MSDFVIIGFKTEYIGERAIDWVEIAPSGEAFDRTRTWHRIKDVTPPKDVDDTRRDSMSFKIAEARWQKIQPKYEAYKRGQDIPEDGTPLAAWAGVSPEQAAHLNAMGLRTVEAVRDMSESAVSRLPFPNARKLSQLAGDFLASKGEAAKDAELAEMRERMAAMEEMLAERMTTPVAHYPDGNGATTAEKRGPGRPKKVAEEEAA